ncbi:hypothetical protein FB566_2748 [Stackebrandtia endophytica]|uniref:Uncharacterized protein n=1 Tax=Stackebrandtia endophytica TaxID=1496996 RepID=A0A543AXA7_9ACTN|nr:hypothetical protein FB566_2748 [Stackebrandtia endophytica]
MKVLGRWGRDSRRVARSWALPLVRVVLLAGVAGAAWLAGVAAAHADPIAGPAQDSENVSGFVPASTSNTGTAAAAPEQAALAPVNQLESATASVLDVPGTLLTTISGNDADKATSTATTSADAVARDTDDGEPLNPTANELSAPVDNSNVTSQGPVGTLLSAAQPVTDSLERIARPITAPLTTVGPANGRLDSTGGPLTTLIGLTRPVAAAADQVGTLLTPAAPATSGMFGLPVPTGPAGFHPARQHTVDRDASVRNSGPNASAEQFTAGTDGIDSEQPNWTGGADRRDRSSGPFRVLGQPDPGIATTGGASTGGFPTGCSPYDSGAGRCTFVHTDRNAQVSRVTPRTATFGQLPDHVEDPAVSPD